MFKIFSPFPRKSYNEISPNLNPGNLSSETIKLHTATHLLNEALRKIISSEIKQRGSNITPERLRFDFNFARKLTAEEILSLYDSSANRYSNNFTGIADGNHTWRAYVVDAAGNSNSTFMTITIDRTVPLWSGNKTNITSSSSGQIYFNITFNDSNAADYIFSFYNGSIWINQTAAYVSGTEIQCLSELPTKMFD